MRNRVLLLSLLCLLLAVPAGASEIIVIDAPSLIGIMTNLEGISGTIELPGDVLAVLSATLELSGYAESGILWPPDGSSTPWWVFPYAVYSNGCINGVPGMFYSEFDAVEGEILIQAPVLWWSSQGYEAPWFCWIGGELAISLNCMWGLPTDGSVADPEPFFEITGARLILEVEPPTPTVPMSWGEIKAVYR